MCETLLNLTIIHPFFCNFFPLYQWHSAPLPTLQSIHHSSHLLVLSLKHTFRHVLCQTFLFIPITSIVFFFCKILQQSIWSPAYWEIVFCSRPCHWYASKCAIIFHVLYGPWNKACSLDITPHTNIEKNIRPPTGGNYCVLDRRWWP